MIFIALMELHGGSRGNSRDKRKNCKASHQEFGTELGLFKNRIFQKMVNNWFGGGFGPIWTASSNSA